VLSKYLFTKAKIIRFEKTSFELIVTEMPLTIKLKNLKIQIPVKNELQNLQMYSAFPYVPGICFSLASYSSR